MSAEYKSTAPHTARKSGLHKLLWDLQFNRQRFRQFVGIVFLILATSVGNPNIIFFIPGVMIALLGMAIRMWASGHVKKDKLLATTGPYAYVRHPLYVGNHLIMFGFCLASGLWWTFVLWIIIGVLFYPPAIRHEDRLLERLFPNEWPDWYAKTQALIPSRVPYRRDQAAQWSFRQSLRQNGEPIIAALLLLGLYLLYLRLP